MSRFHVGQRVRVIAVGADVWNFAMGAETHIDADEGSYWHLAIPEPTGWRASVYKENASVYITPINPSGQQPTTWSECLWRPDGSHKTVVEEGRAIALRSIL